MKTSETDQIIRYLKKVANLIINLGNSILESFIICSVVYMLFLAGVEFLTVLLEKKNIHNRTTVIDRRSAHARMSALPCSNECQWALTRTFISSHI